MQVTFYLYRESSGEILSRNTVSAQPGRHHALMAKTAESLSIMHEEPVGFLLDLDECGSRATHYVDPDLLELTEKQPLAATWSKTEITADGVDVAVLSPLPPCTVCVDGDPVYVDDGSFELEALTPGEYTVVIDEPKFIREEWTIDAV